MSVEAVAYDGNTQSVMVGAVNAQLVGASGMRKEGYPRDVSFPFDNAVFGYGLLAVGEIHLLIRSVERVGTQRQAYLAVYRAVGHAVQEGDIPLAYLTLGKLRLELLVRFHVKGYYYKP